MYYNTHTDNYDVDNDTIPMMVIVVVLLL